MNGSYLLGSSKHGMSPRITLSLNSCKFVVGVNSGRLPRHLRAKRRTTVGLFISLGIAKSEGIKVSRYSVNNEVNSLTE